MRPKAGGAAFICFQETGPGLGQAEKPQSVAGRGRVEDDVVKARVVVCQQADEFVEGGNLCGAGAGELFAHGGAVLLARPRSHLAEHAQTVVFGCRFGIDVHGE